MKKALAPILFTSLHRRNQEVLLKALLDSGTGTSLIKYKFTKNLGATNENAHWVTITGRFSTKGTVETQFQLTELNPTATIMYKLHVTDSLGIYHMIIGRDLLYKIELTLDLSTENIMWNGTSVPMKDTTETAIESLHINDLKGIDNVVGHISG